MHPLANTHTHINNNGKKWKRAMNFIECGRWTVSVTWENLKWGKGIKDVMINWKNKNIKSGYKTKKDDLQMIVKHKTQRSLKLLAIRDMQIKTTLIFHLILNRMVKINKIISSRCWRGCGESGKQYCCYGNLSLWKPA